MLLLNCLLSFWLYSRFSCLQGSEVTSNCVLAEALPSVKVMPRGYTTSRVILVVGLQFLQRPTQPTALAQPWGFINIVPKQKPRESRIPVGEASTRPVVVQSLRVPRRCLGQEWSPELKVAGTWRPKEDVTDAGEISDLAQT